MAVIESLVLDARTEDQRVQQPRLRSAHETRKVQAHHPQSLTNRKTEFLLPCYRPFHHACNSRTRGSWKGERGIYKKLTEKYYRSIYLLQKKRRKRHANNRSSSWTTESVCQRSTNWHQQRADWLQDRTSPAQSTSRIKLGKPNTSFTSVGWSPATFDTIWSLKRQAEYISFFSRKQSNLKLNLIQKLHVPCITSLPISKIRTVSVVRWLLVCQ